MNYLNGRLAKLEATITPPIPPTYQVIWPDGRQGPVMIAPYGRWQGLVVLRIVYDDPGDSDATTRAAE